MSEGRNGTNDVIVPIDDILIPCTSTSSVSKECVELYTSEEVINFNVEKYRMDERANQRVKGYFFHLQKLL